MLITEYPELEGTPIHLIYEYKEFRFPYFVSNKLNWRSGNKSYQKPSNTVLSLSGSLEQHRNHSAVICSQQDAQIDVQSKTISLIHNSVIYYVQRHPINSKQKETIGNIRRHVNTTFIFPRKYSGLPYCLSSFSEAYLNSILIWLSWMTSHFLHDRR